MPTTTPFPHQDPAPQPRLPGDVSLLEHVTTLIAALDRHFEGVYEDLKVSVAQRFEDNDLRYQQRFDAQTLALEAALAAQKEAVETALVAAEKATSKAETASDKRFESVNEFRAQLSDQTATFMPRSEAEQRMSALSEKIADMKTSLDTSSGLAAGTQVDRQLQKLTGVVDAQGDRLSVQGGRSVGLQAGWVYLLGGLGAIGTIISIVLILTRTHA